MTRLTAWFHHHTASDDRITRAMKMVILLVALFSGIGLLANYVLFLFSYDDEGFFDHVVLLIAPFCVVLSAPKYAVETKNIFVAANVVFAASYVVVLANTIHAGTVVATVTYFLLALAICYALMFGWRGFAIAASISVAHFALFGLLGDLLRSEFSLAHRHEQVITVGNLVGIAKNYALIFLTASSCAATFHQQMNQSVRELAEARKNAETANAAKSDFLANMSHEIRTPMSGVIGMLEVLHRGDISGTQRAQSDMALRSARSLMFVLDDIIDVSRVENRQLSLDREPASISHILDEVVTLFDTLAREKSIKLSASVDPSVPAWVMSDPRRIRQVLTNLVGNGLKFTDDGSVHVSVSYDASMQVAEFAVSDTGSGIAKDALDKVFDQFFQADTSPSRKHSGSGLGLTISKQLVTLMGGEIAVDSRPGTGSVFRFTVAAPEAQAPSIKRQVKRATPAPGLRLLVAEDNAAMQQILRAVLESGGHQVTIATNGKDAVVLAQSERFDVILMDMMMPIMDGPTAVQCIRNQGGFAANVPIIAMTANALVDDRDRYLKLGMTEYLSKPVDIPALFEVLAKVTATTSNHS